MVYDCVWLLSAIVRCVDAGLSAERDFRPLWLPLGEPTGRPRLRGNPQAQALSSSPAAFAAEARVTEPPVR